MRTLLILGLAIGGAYMAGWFTLERDGDKTRIEINKTEIRSDARQAIDKGRDYLDQREQERLARQQNEATQAGYPQANYGQPAYPQNNYPMPSGQPGYGQVDYTQQPAPWGQPAGYQGGTPVQGAGYQQTAPPSYNSPAPWQTQTR